MRMKKDNKAKYRANSLLREFLGHNFVSRLRTLKPKNLKKPSKTLSKKPRFFQPRALALCVKLSKIPIERPMSQSVSQEKSRAEIAVRSMQ